MKVKTSVETLRTKMRFITDEFPDRSVTNPEQFHALYSKLRDVIEETDYNIDIADCLSALHCAMEDFEMYA